MAKVANVHIDGFLTEALLGYKNSRYGANMALPRINASKLSGKIPSLDNSHFRLDQDVREIGGAANRVSFDYSSVSFDAEERTLEVPVDDRLVAKTDDPMDVRRDAALVAMSKLELRREARIGSLITSTANYASTDHYDTADKAWDGTGNPITDVQAGIAQIVSVTGADLSNIVGVCNYQVYKLLKTNAKVLANYTSTIPGAANMDNMTPQQIAGVLGLRDLYVSNAVYNTAAEGATEAFAYAWGGDDDFVIMAAEAANGMMPETFAAVVSPTVPGYPGAEVVVDSYRDEPAKSEIIRATFVCDEIVVNSKYGYLFTNVD